MIVTFTSCYLLNWLICTKLHLRSSPKFELMRAAVLTKLSYFQVPPSDIARPNQTAAVGCEWLRLRFKLGRDGVMMCAATVGLHDAIASVFCQLVLVGTKRRARRAGGEVSAHWDSLVLSYQVNLCVR